MIYLHVESGDYPLMSEQVMARHPGFSFPVPFEAPGGYAIVRPSRPPSHAPATHRLAEQAPCLVDGDWVQSWTVVALTQDEIASRAAAEVAALRQARADKVAAINAQYGRRTAAIADGYPASERESWPVQTREAQALLADAAAKTPWIDAAAAARAIDRTELARRITALDMAYRAAHGALSGTRQRLEDMARAAADLAALQAIDETAGWPWPGAAA